MKTLLRVALPRLFLGFLLAGLAFAAHAAEKPWPFITVKGDRLMEGDRPFRFFGLTTPNLQQNESQILPDRSNRFPDDYEIRDTLDTLHRLGARVTRTFALSVASPVDRGMPVYIEGRRRYNEEAFRALDRAIALCHEYDVRLIIPIIASQSFGGIRGVDEFAALSGHTEQGAFWTNEAVKADFRALLDHLMNRRNTVNGLRYKDDPAIMAWQLGNEFLSYAPDRKLDPKTWTPRITAWSLEMAAYLKRIDPNHLVMEAGGDRSALLASPYIDVMSTHLYEYWNRLFGGPTDLSTGARADWAQCRGKKPLIVDEFGLATAANVRSLMRTIRETGISGGLLWSLRSHRRDGGFYYHNEGGTPVNSYHFPGFATGQPYDETLLLDLVRAEAYRIRGQALPPVTAPSPAPVLRVIYGFTWRGSTGAGRYAIERACSAAGPWVVMVDGVQDSVVDDVKAFEASGASAPLVLWTDETAEPGRTYYYRVRGFNAAGATGYSNVVSAEASVQ